MIYLDLRVLEILAMHLEPLETHNQANLEMELMLVVHHQFLQIYLEQSLLDSTGSITSNNIIHNNQEHNKSQAMVLPISLTNTEVWLQDRIQISNIHTGLDPVIRLLGITNLAPRQIIEVCHQEQECPEPILHQTIR